MAVKIQDSVVRKKLKPASLWMVGLLVGGLFVAGAIATYNLRNQGMSREEISQLTVPVEANNITLRITASGKVTPIQSVNISPKNAGIVAQLYVEQGDTVERGQVIAKMNSEDVQARVQQARANLAQSKAQLDQARAGNRPQEIAQVQSQVDAAQAKVNYTSEQVKRYKYLVEQGAERRQLLDQALSEDNAAKASLRETQKRLSLQQSGTRVEEIAQRQAAVASAKAQLQAELVTLADSIIRAPFSGIITQKYANIGAFVTPTTSASASASATSSSVVALAEGLEILASVPEADIGRIKEGQNVEIISDAYPEEVFKGKVRLIAPEAVKEEGVTLFQVRVKITTGEDKLRSGLNVDLTFLGDQVTNALLVPTVAIVTEKGNTGVLVPDSKNKPQFRPIIIGSQIKNQTQVVEGIKEGDRIFLNPPPEYQMQKQLEKKDQ
jgi:HlyD family secretion protein